MSLCNFIPASGLPHNTGFPSGQEVQWLCGDSLENYRRRGRYSVYGENDISYRFNSHGYRCPEFDVNADVRIIAIGCSYVFGVGLPQHAIFHELFANRLRVESAKTVVVWNLGVPGTSNDYIARLLHLAVPRLNPHMVLVGFTHIPRREYVSPQGRVVHYTPSVAVATLHNTPLNTEVYGHFLALGSTFDDQLNFFRNYKSIESLLKGRCWLFSVPCYAVLKSAADHIDRHRYVGELPHLDKARDLAGHPGPESHRRFAELYWTKFMELGGLVPLEEETIKSNPNRYQLEIRQKL